MVVDVSHHTSTRVNAAAAAIVKESVMRKFLVIVLFFAMSCGAQEEILKKDLQTCQQKHQETEDALSLSTATNASLRQDITEVENAYDTMVSQICKEGLEKTESAWEKSSVTAGTRAWEVLHCTPNHTVKMGVIDTKRKITALQIKKADGTFMASRPFSWTSEVDKWHVIAPDLLLEVVSCAASSCEVVCHSRSVKIAPLPSCTP